MSQTDNGVMLAFSGGGTRAAALSYGVLQQLRDTLIGSEDEKRRLLDDVGVISSVSGGSFTAAYYGLHGDKIFDDYETTFLKKDVTGSLVSSLLNPLNWFTSIDRTEYAIQYYETEVFKNATFADMLRPGAPMVLINATDLTGGVRFSFMQEYFDLLCSDLSSFPLSRAVTASSAVPLLFKPVVVENHEGCSEGKPDWLVSAKERAAEDPELALTVKGMESYFDKVNHKYAHFVDGGISDNLGLRSIFDMTRLAGGTKEMLDFFNIDLARRFVIILVDASTQPANGMGTRRDAPSIASTINAMTDIQLHRYNTATVAEMNQSLRAWGQQLSTSSEPVEPYFIRLSFEDIADKKTREYVNEIPTSLSLSEEQVDTVVQVGRDLLRTNEEFQRLLSDIAKAE
ncbi:MAG: patatin-like phospholipase family protein [Gammaproteobacteria bacterium]|nr:patatin-like phospholipase family protein [Gammaproteobacteria bacterium]